MKEIKEDEKIQSESAGQEVPKTENESLEPEVEKNQNELTDKEDGKTSNELAEQELEKTQNEIIDQKNQTVGTSTKAKKIIIIVSIVAGVILVSAAIVLLVGHFKFDWFKSTNYPIDAKITRSLYQANYFKENKTIEAAFAFSDGNTTKKNFTVMNDFVVIMGKVKKLRWNRLLYTAYLIILDSKIKSEDKEYQLSSFNIFDEGTIKAFETDPNGKPHPIAIFRFYENGTVFDIKLPNNTDKFTADTIVELIENVIPKLSRNRTEDMNDGVEVQTRKHKRHKGRRRRTTISETQTNRTHKQFRGSRYSKKIERDIEDEQISNITIESNTTLQNDDDDDDDNSDQSDIGIKNVSFNTHSEINATRTSEEKDLSELIEKIGNKVNFITNKKQLMIF